MPIQGRTPNAIKKAVNSRSRKRRESNAAEARLAAAVTRSIGDNQLLKTCPLEMVAPGDLSPPPRQVHKRDAAQVARWVTFVQRFGFLPPLIIREQLIVNGTDRWEAAMAIKLPELVCLRVDHLSERDAEIVAIAMQVQADHLELDPDMVRIILQDMEPLDLEFTFLDPAQIDMLLVDDDPGANEEEVLPEIPAAPASRPGDLFLMGRHRLLCADATVASSYVRLMAGTSARATLTDTPFNVDIAGNVSGLGQVKHGEFIMASGEMSEPQFYNFLVTVFSHCRDHVMDGAMIASFIDFRSVASMINAGKQAGLTLLNLAVWNKQTGAMGAYLRSAHELVPIFCKGDQLACNNVMLGKHGRDRTNVWTYPGANRRGTEAAGVLESHPTPKNPTMIEDAILDVTLRDEIILDPFLGSGTTLVAAERAGRWCHGLELDPKYVDVCVRRWERLTGRQAIHEETGLAFAEIAARRSMPDGSDGNAV